jgi:cytochrome c oxidase accessory protein FixG
MLFDFCFFREQTCILACPYGRFQSVMLDRQSLVISYDANRGEPRGKANRRTDPMQLAVLRERGDCVDCGMCVTTCPTGIDIRDGLQMECIGCAQCIDACDAVMTKIDRPRGLIRYSSQAAIAGERARLIRPRAIIYPLLLVIVLCLFTIVLVNQSDANVTVLRGLGRPFTLMESGDIANQTRIKIINRTDRAAEYRISVELPAHPATDKLRIQLEEHPLRVNPGEARTVPMMIVAAPELFVRGKCPVTIAVSDGAQFQQCHHWELLGPAAPSGATP